MARASYEAGLGEVAEGVFAYLQPHGGWGLSNAGLVVHDGVSLLVDTLFDRVHTERMLAAMRRATDAARRVDLVVNTHANGDHCWGNELVRDARIIASDACAREMRDMTPAKLALLMNVARVVTDLGSVGSSLGVLCRAVGLTQMASLLDASPYVMRAFSRFHFDGIELVPPSETFTGSTELFVGSRRVELVEVGPAHTRGDVMVFVPDARTVFTGDILFAQAHPILWEGPAANWIAACDAVLERSPQIVVSGHGPVTGIEAVRATRDYLVWIRDEAEKRYAAGLSVEEAAQDLDLGPYEEWSEPERVVVNVAACYRELMEDPTPGNAIEAFGAMARWERARSQRE